ncbi:MAG: hypothetical protein H7125_04115 [Proteobacteria bacterium]|nr:hypothetical protein [Burkholderiales bacterium]
MSFDRHAFISYAHIDNEPLTPEQKGWVTRFHATLGTMLSQRIGQKADIWRDDKLAGNDVFSEEIVDQFARTALLISVLTPRYLKSEWCTREIREFCAAAERTGGLLVDNKCRVFKVIKTPVDSEACLPPVIGQVLGYEFFALDEDQTPRDLDPVFGDASRQEFLRKLNKLAWDIAQLWEQLDERRTATADEVVTNGRTEAATTQAPRGVRKPAVFLAQVSRDQRAAREMIEAGLKRHGYVVLPDRQLPLDEEMFVCAVESCLAQCAFSIHLIGNGYGVVPDGPSQRSLVVLQNELAAAHSRDRGLKRLIWIPPGTAGEQPAQRAFIATLLSDASAQLGADLLTGDIESVKGAVHAALTRIELAQTTERARAPANGATESHKAVYLLCDERDRRDIVPLIRHLRSAGLEVTTPVFTGDAATVREANQQRLATCDAVILFYGAGDEAWKYHQENELRKMAGLHVSHSAPPVHLYVSAPASPDKELLVSLQEPNLIDGSGGLAVEALAPFIAALRSGDALSCR